MKTEPKPGPEPEQAGNLNPGTITLSTFTTLLTYYNPTINKVWLRKAMPKAGVPKRGPSAKAKAKAAPVPNVGANEQKAQDAEILRTAESKLEEMLALDAWRYAGAGAGAGTADADAARKLELELGLDKDKLVRLVEWKMKHGQHRPTLIPLIKGNTDSDIAETTRAAFSLLSKQDKSSIPLDSPPEPDHSTRAEDREFDIVNKALGKVTELRGVGPATGSLMLSVAGIAGRAKKGPVVDVPFFSDWVFLWLCRGVYPSFSASVFSSGKGGWVRGENEAENVKDSGSLKGVSYTQKEYRELWGAVWGLRGRLNEDVEDGKWVSCADVEKVAFVIRFIENSGYLEGGGGLKREGKIEKTEKEEREKEEDGGTRKRRRLRSG
ncbi:hypothetical protein BJX99DRAFT_46921 [Aspergillus californicus]